MRGRNKKASKLHLLTIPLVLAIGVLAFVVWFYSASQPVNPDQPTRVNFTISQGEALDSIAQTLKEKGLIRSVPAFRIQVMVSGLATQIQAGDFAISPATDLKTVAQALTVGTSDRWVTFLEGWRRQEYAQSLVDVLSEENDDYAFNPDQFLALTAELEGKLYPDTYSFPRTATAQVVVDRLTGRFQEQTAELNNQSGLTDYEALILASLIEREALSDSERPVVAGVLMNRLEIGMALQVDATVQFALANRDCRLLTCDWWPQNITRDDLDISSPYNTYAQPGLPPAPISNPSLVSIKAAYNPQSTDYFYYIHDESGNIHFAQTLDGHNANVAKYLR